MDFQIEPEQFGNSSVHLAASRLNKLATGFRTKMPCALNQLSADPSPVLKVFSSEFNIS